MATRKEQSAQARGRLIQAAKDLISQRGYDAVTIADITSACNMSVGNFYNYFKTKGDIIAVLERDPYVRTVDELLKQGGTAQQLLTAYVRKWNELGIQSFGADFYRQWFIYHVNHPTPAGDPQCKVNLSLEEISQCIQVGIKQGELRTDTPVKTIALDIALSLFGADFAYVTTAGEFSRLQWCEEYCEKILPSLLAPYYVNPH